VGDDDEPQLTNKTNSGVRTAMNNCLNGHPKPQRGDLSLDATLKELDAPAGAEAVAELVGAAWLKPCPDTRQQQS
jgi:hypothetical protein